MSMNENSTDLEIATDVMDSSKRKREDEEADVKVGSIDESDHQPEKKATHEHLASPEIGSYISVEWELDGGDTLKATGHITDKRVFEEPAKPTKYKILFDEDLVFANGEVKREMWTKLAGLKFSILSTTAHASMAAALAAPQMGQMVDRREGEELNSMVRINPAEGGSLDVLNMSNRKSLMDVSRRQYSFGWKRYLDFCMLKGVAIDGSCPDYKIELSELMESFLVYLVEGAEKTVTPTVANQYISAVGKFLLESKVIDSIKDIRTAKFQKTLSTYTKQIKLAKEQERQQQMQQLQQQQQQQASDAQALVSGLPHPEQGHEESLR